MMSLIPFKFSYLCFAIIILILKTAYCGKQIEDWAYHRTLDHNNMYHLFWTAEENSITFQVVVATKGWIGLGLSPTGGIAGSDIVIGWVDRNRTSFYDYYAKDDATFIKDKQQDWKLLSGSENKTHTSLTFSRLLETCDIEDRPITNDSQRVLFTYYPKDPGSSNSVNFRQTVWTEHHLKLLQPRKKMVPMPETVSIWDVRAQNFTIPPTNETFYYCRILRSPPLRKKHHVIKVTPMVRPQNTMVAHHISLYACAVRTIKEAEEAVAYGPTECHKEYLPSLFNRCNAFYFGWGLGGGTFVFPNHVGLPLGGETQYFMFQIHYDNPEFWTGIVDDSGFRFYYTPHLRPNDARSFIVGPNAFWPITHVFPPGEKELIAVGHGHPSCIAQEMPKEGIKIFAAWLHGHLLVRKIIMRHFRNNKELPPIAMDMQYGTHFQEYTFFERDIKLLPGDQLTTECSVDSRGQVVATLAGLGTNEEMCNVYVFTYPPLPISWIGSSPTLEIVAGMTGMNLTERDYTFMNLFGEPNVHYADFLRDYDWPESQRCIFHNALRYSPQDTFCFNWNETHIRTPMGTYPENLKPYRFPNQCKGRMGPRREREMTTRCDRNV